MIGSPKSLTAIVHVRFHHNKESGSESWPSDLEMVGKILERASEMGPDMQEILVKFADYLRDLDGTKVGQKPG